MHFSDTKIIVTDINHVAVVRTENTIPTAHFRNRAYYGLAFKLSGHAVYSFKGRVVDSFPNTLAFCQKVLTMKSHIQKLVNVLL